MSDFKQATRQKLRFDTSFGSLVTEQLWDLPKEELNNIAVSFDEQLESSEKKSYLESKTEKNKILQLKRNIVVEILETLIKESKEASEEYENKIHNAKIDALIARKEEQELEGKSVEELEKLRK